MSAFRTGMVSGLSEEVDQNCFDEYLANSKNCDARNSEASNIFASLNLDETVAITDRCNGFGSFLHDFGSQDYDPLAPLQCDSWLNVSNRIYVIQ